MPSTVDAFLLALKALERVLRAAERLPAPLRERMLDAAFGKADPDVPGYDPSRLLPGPMPPVPA